MTRTLMKFFRMLIRRRYFPDELTGSTPWSGPANSSFSGSREISRNEDQQHNCSRPRIQGRCTTFWVMGFSTPILIPGEMKGALLTQHSFVCFLARDLHQKTEKTSSLFSKQPVSRIGW